MIDINNKIKVTALVSVYKSEIYIKGCLEDLLNQTLYKKGKLEILIINSNSPENEEKIILPYLKKYRNLTYIKTRKRESLYASWNRGIKVAKGKYITNANTDDRHRYDALEIESNFLDKNPKISLVYSDCYESKIDNETFEENDKKTPYHYPDFFAPDCLLVYQFGINPMWRKSVHEKIGYFDPELKVVGDYAFNISVALNFRVLHINKCLGLYLKRKFSLSFVDNKANEELLEIKKRFRKTFYIEKLYKMEGYKVSTSIQKAYIFYNLGRRAMSYSLAWLQGKKQSDYDFALQCFSWSITSNPFFLPTWLYIVYVKMIRVTKYQISRLRKVFE